VSAEPLIADLVPQRLGEAADAATGVVVRLSGARYAVPMYAVAEVGRVPRVTRVPGVPDWVAGVANWRGRILPVVDLRPLLGSRDRVIGPDARIVVAGDDAISVGLVVDAVDGVTVLPADDLDAAPATIGPDAAALLAGQWSDEQGPIGVLDVAALLRLRAQLPHLIGRKS
jgi:chemotaxis signal transduction protein